MKIQKTYQGAIPLNRIANEHNESEVNTYSTQYLNNRLVCASPYQPEDGAEVWIQQSKNLFNINGNVNISGAGGGQTSLNTVSNNVLTAGANTYDTHNVGQKFTNLQGKTFTVSAKILSVGTGTDGYTAIYDNNVLKKGLSVQTGQTVTLTYTGTTDNIVVGFATASGTGAQFTDIQVEVGNTATGFEPYVDKKIYVKNDNGIYEEFCRAENKSAVLWENNAPTSSFAPQSIHLNSDDYDYLEFAFCPNTGNSEAYWFKVKKGDNITAQLITGGTSAVYIRNRICDYVSDTEYSLRDSRTFSALNAANSEIDNSRVIPIRVIGYKY